MVKPLWSPVLALAPVDLAGGYEEPPPARAVAASAERRVDAAFERLYREQAPYVFRVLRALGVREADLPDVVHDVFITVHRRSDADVYSSQRAWVHGIAVRTAANYRRRAQQKRERLFADVPETQVSAEPGAAFDLLRALGALDEDQRAVFVLYEIEELSMPEVAEALGCPPSTAYSRLYAARRAMRRLYALKGSRP